MEQAFETWRKKRVRENTQGIFVFWRVMKNLRRLWLLQKILNLSVSTAEELPIAMQISVIPCC